MRRRRPSDAIVGGRERPEDPDARVDHRRGRAQPREQRDLGVPALGRPWGRRSRARSRPVRAAAPGRGGGGSRRPGRARSPVGGGRWSGAARATRDHSHRRSHAAPRRRSRPAGCARARARGATWSRCRPRRGRWSNTARVVPGPGRRLAAPSSIDSGYRGARRSGRYTVTPRACASRSTGSPGATNAGTSAIA